MKILELESNRTTYIEMASTGIINYLRDSSNKSLADFVPSEIYHMIDPYWYSWPPMEPMWFGVIGFFVSILGVMSLSGNFIVMYIFTSSKSLRTPSNMFVVNLAFSDFMMMFTMFPPMVLNSFYQTWIMGPLLCEIYGLCGSLFGCVNIWSMTLIARDRYNVIVKGISRKPLTATGALIQLLVIWCICGIWSILPMLGWNRYVPEGNLTVCGTDYFAKDWWNRSYIMVYFVWVYVTPLSTIIYSYWYIMKAVRIHEQQMREQAKKMNVASLRNSEADKGKSVEIKLAKVALVTISLWFFAWTPYTVINFSGIFGSMYLSPLSTVLGSAFAKANSVYNPIVYGLSHPKYKQVLREKMPCLACDRKDTGSDAKTQVTAEYSESVA
ncbi:opsin Rh6-like [Teleopsis dalmanni]|uniref:opsin Rh6-like n=1 Tax=Teleopsis dalmanni TaxID=139649 RepID=UPI000D32B432|nr:opsin Rh6-like [Teleopsis dalmanni]